MNSLFFPTNPRFNIANQRQSFSYSCHLHSSPYSKLCFYPRSSQSPSLRYRVHRNLTQSPHCPHQSMRAFLQQIIGFVENKELNYSLKESVTYCCIFPFPGKSAKGHLKLLNTQVTAALTTQRVALLSSRESPYGRSAVSSHLPLPIPSTFLCDMSGVPGGSGLSFIKAPSKTDQAFSLPGNPALCALQITSPKLELSHSSFWARALTITNSKQLTQNHFASVTPGSTGP